MSRWGRLSVALSAVLAVLSGPLLCRAQGVGAALPGTNTFTDGPWEITLDGRVGFPIGSLKVGEFPTMAPKGGGTPGTRFRLSDLGVTVSEVLESSVAFYLTPRDAVRVGYLYYFLDGRSTQHQSVVFNGQEFTAGSLRTNADFQRMSLDYERELLGRSSGEHLIGSAGLTYVNFNPTLTGNTPSKGPSEAHGGSNSEDFYRQELPVPILGLRWDHPVGERLVLRTSVAGGGLPRVDSLRKEGGTIYLQQSHADADAGLVYVLGRHAQAEVGYHFTYFFQEEKSHEDKNRFELIDNGLHFGLTVRF